MDIQLEIVKSEQSIKDLQKILKGDTFNNSDKEIIELINVYKGRLATLKQLT